MFEIKPKRKNEQNDSSINTNLKYFRTKRNVWFANWAESLPKKKFRFTFESRASKMQHLRLHNNNSNNRKKKIKKRRLELKSSWIAWRGGPPRSRPTSWTPSRRRGRSRRKWSTENLKKTEIRPWEKFWPRNTLSTGVKDATTLLTLIV